MSCADSDPIIISSLGFRHLQLLPTFDPLLQLVNGEPLRCGHTNSKILLSSLHGCGVAPAKISAFHKALAGVAWFGANMSPIP
jgi:hypothetical protein